MHESVISHEYVHMKQHLCCKHAVKKKTRCCKRAYLKPGEPIRLSDVASSEFSAPSSKEMTLVTGPYSSKGPH